MPALGIPEESFPHQVSGEPKTQRISVWLVYAIIYMTKHVSLKSVFILQCVHFQSIFQVAQYFNVLVIGFACEVEQ